ncbi:MAG TPA: TolC family protein [Gemmatimonadales bacterium]|nr:TolC family protein [Gemmatimonadales bacterium]
MRRLVITPLLLAGCATYTARPLETADAAARYHDRRVDAPAVRAALDSLGVPSSAEGWRDWEFAEAAWVIRPERARLEAQVRAAEAVLVTAGARPDPGLVTETEYAFSGSGSESRWGPAVSGVFTVELGGKRSARIGRANAGVLVAVAQASNEAWAVRWRVREALTEREVARHRLASAQQEFALLDSELVVVRARYRDGTVSRVELARVEADRQDWQAEVAARRRDFEGRRAALAAAMGFSASQVDSIPLVRSDTSFCDLAVATDSLDALALRSRRELLEVLGEYQVAEAEVRLAVAETWPDIALGPGLFYDRGVGKWTIGFSLPSIALNRHKGPIGEAEARREVAARRVAEVQEMILSSVEVAEAGCVAAREERDSLKVSGVRTQLELLDSAYARGEIGQLDLVLARLDVARAAGHLVDAEDRLWLAGLDLEHALGVWSGAPASRPEKRDL